MTATMHASTPAIRRTGTILETGITPRRRRARRQRASHKHSALGRYLDRHGHAREVIAQQGAAGSTLVVDRERAGHGDARLVAHLAADEPAENAALVCSSYLQYLASGGGRCRRLDPEDAHVTPFVHQRETHAGQPRDVQPQPVDRCARAYSLEPVPGGMSIPELRWCRREHGTSTAGEPVSLRDAIAALESYEPLRERTLDALAAHAHAGAVSTALLRVELTRVQQSPIVLNRRLREVVLATVARHELSMSEIALRCGRVKRDRKGNESGETSWLARRIGLFPEGGHSLPTPWIHSDVLALIARCGLGIAPHEVEL
jgi:hypothetical protein